MDFVAKAVVIGLTEQAPLILAAIGMALIYQLSNVINVAYAETITLGAYFGGQTHRRESLRCLPCLL